MRAALRQRILVGVLVTLALPVAGNWIMGSHQDATVTPPGLVDASCVSRQTDNKRSQNSGSSDPTLHLAQLESTEHNRYAGTGRNIFWYVENAPQKVAPEPKADKSALEVRPRETETSLRFFGYALMGNLPKRVFLKDGDALFVAREGDVIDRRYKIVRVEQNSVDVEDLLEQTALTIALQG